MIVEEEDCPALQTFSVNDQESSDKPGNHVLETESYEHYVLS